MIAKIRNKVIDRSRTASADRLNRCMLCAPLTHLDSLSLVQEVSTDGDDRVSDFDSAAHNGVLTIESDQFHRSIRHRRGLEVEEPNSRALPLIVDRPEWNRHCTGRLRAVQVYGYRRSE